MKKRSNYIDILKGIGIVSIVIGHASTGLLNSFVYTYHLMIFFFVVGLCFSEEKAERPAEFFGKYVVKLLVLYIAYNTFFVAFHNLFAQWNLTPGRWERRNLFELLFYPLILTSADPFLGAFWFIPMFLCGVFVYSISFSLAMSTRYRVMVNLTLALIWGIIALTINQYGITFGYHIQTSFLGVPIIYAGYYAKKLWKRIDKLLHPVGCALSIALILLVLHFVGRIELSANQIIDKFFFYPITLVGIYFCCCLAKLLNSTSMSKAFGWIGKNSFHIMAMHFLAFKLVDVVYCMALGIADPQVISRYPNSGFPITILYWLAGVFLPLGFVTLAKIGGENLKEKLQWLLIN